ncbi:MAG TPA: magnesium transporter CorA family protein [Anaerolineales bacterium]|nr:magnesium transporter CorA family protein [Anaerolineales bacterium]
MVIYRRTPGTDLERIHEFAEGCWVSLVDPTPAEIEEIHQKLAIPQDFITSSLDLGEIPRAEKEDGIHLIIIRVPVDVGKESDIPYTTVPLSIVMTDGVVLTSSKIRNPVVEEMASGRVRSLDTAKRNRFLLRVLLETGKQFLHYLSEINREVELLEDKLQMSLRNREVLGLLKYQKSLTLFTTALRSDELVMARLQKGQLFQMYPEDEDLLEDVLTEIGQAIQMTDVSTGILSQMMDAFASIISNNLNVVMKFLASATIILALPTLIASIYGMNLNLPFQRHPQAFFITMGTAVLISLVVVVVFIRKDWL